MWRRNSKQVEPGMSLTATDYAQRIVDLEARASGDVPGALARLERRYGFSRWTLDRLRRGRTKRVEVGLFAKLRCAYLAECERQILKLQQELAIERAMGGDLDDMADLDREAEELAAKVARAKAAALAARRD